MTLFTAPPAYVHQKSGYLQPIFNGLIGRSAPFMTISKTQLIQFVIDYFTLGDDTRFIPIMANV